MAICSAVVLDLQRAGGGVLCCGSSRLESGFLQMADKP